MSGNRELVKLRVGAKIYSIPKSVATMIFESLKSWGPGVPVGSIDKPAPVSHKIPGAIKPKSRVKLK